MTVNPSAIHYCKAPCDCSGVSAAPFTIRRNDTCPHMEIEVRGAAGRPVDLKDWSAKGMLYALTNTSMELPDNESKVYLDDVSSVHRGDVLRVESEDAPRELMDVISVDRSESSVMVTRGFQGTMPKVHLYGSTVYVIKRDNIPVDIETIYSSDAILNFQVVVIADDDNDLSGEEDTTPSGSEKTVKQSKLSVRWRVEDTARAGRYLLQVTLTGPNGERMTLPRNSAGYPITILSDADDQV